jgi:glycosyltransferase involved in cell wall biosynthesis
LVTSNNSPLISAVVPVFNKAQFLKEAVESICAQSYPNIEIIICNDGSSDNSLAVAQEIAANHKDRKITLLDQKNLGVSACRNAGLAKANGEFLFSLDGDDRLDSRYVEKALYAFNNEGVDLFCSDVLLFGVENGEWIPDPFDPYFLRYNNSIPTAAIYHRSIYTRTGGYKVSLTFAEDWDFFINATRGGLKVKTLREKLYHYRRTDNGILAKFLKDRWEQPVAIIMLANSDLYNVEDIRFSLEKLLKGNDKYEAEFLTQSKRFPNEWLPALVLGIFAQGHTKMDAALQFYGNAVQKSNFKEWLPLYCLGMVLDILGKNKEAADIFHECRILRPDAHFLVTEKIKAAWGKSLT